MQLRFGIMVRGGLILLAGAPILDGHKTVDAASAQPRVRGINPHESIREAMSAAE